MFREKTYYVYILTNRSGTLYIGVTDDLLKRLDQHKRSLVAGFASTYRIDRLVYFEETSDVFAALEREKQIKKWRRQKKIDLINSMNPKWVDLSEEWRDPREPRNSD